MVISEVVDVGPDIAAGPGRLTTGEDVTVVPDITTADDVVFLPIGPFVCLSVCPQDYCLKI